MTEQRQLSPAAAFHRDINSDGVKSELMKMFENKTQEVNRFLAICSSMVQLRPELLAADKSSLLGAFKQAARDGLMPDDREATIQIYKTNVKVGGQDVWVDKAQYMPMVRGIVMKMYEAGCTKVTAAAVYEKDHFEYVMGDEEKIVHMPHRAINDDGGKIIAAYAIITLSNGDKKREVVWRRDIEKVREASKSKNGPGWTNWYDQFAIKAVLKRVSKQLPGRNHALDSVLDADNQAMDFQFERDITPAKKPAVQSLSQAMGARNEAETVEPEQQGAGEVDEGSAHSDGELDGAGSVPSGGQDQ